MDKHTIGVNRGNDKRWIAETPSGEVASAEIVIWDNKRAYRWSAASHTAFKDTGATSLLLDEIFQDLKNKGVKEIYLMSGNIPRFAKFALSFNPGLVPYYSIEKKRSLVKIAETVYYILRWGGENHG